MIVSTEIANSKNIQMILLPAYYEFLSLSDYVAELSRLQQSALYLENELAFIQQKIAHSMSRAEVSRLVDLWAGLFFEYGQNRLDQVAVRSILKQNTGN